MRDTDCAVSIQAARMQQGKRRREERERGQTTKKFCRYELVGERPISGHQPSGRLGSSLTASSALNESTAPATFHGCGSPDDKQAAAHTNKRSIAKIIRRENLAAQADEGLLSQTEQVCAHKCLLPSVPYYVQLVEVTMTSVIKNMRFWSAHRL